MANLLDKRHVKTEKLNKIINEYSLIDVQFYIQRTVHSRNTLVPLYL